MPLHHSRHARFIDDLKTSIRRVFITAEQLLVDLVTFRIFFVDAHPRLFLAKGVEPTRSFFRPRIEIGIISVRALVHAHAMFDCVVGAFALHDSYFPLDHVLCVEDLPIQIILHRKGKLEGLLVFASLRHVKAVLI